MSSPSPSPGRGTIRFEDLGEPVQRLLKSLHNELTDEDYELLEYVSVKDMAKIYSDMGTDRHAETIWEELRTSLQERREAVARRESELRQRQEQLDAERAAEESRLKAQEEEDERERKAEEEEAAARQREVDAATERAEQDEANEATAAERERQLKEEEAARAEARLKKAEKKRKRREARARELQEEQEALQAEQARQLAARKRDQKKDWSAYVDSHPLQFTSDADGKGAAEDREIAQEKVAHMLNTPVKVADEVLYRTYTPKCPRCNSRFTQPPRGWLCPVCLQRERKEVLVWQPDAEARVCMICKKGLGRFRRHHCRNCGRVVCADCCGNRAVIPGLNFVTPVKVCDECAQQQPVARPLP